VVRRWLPGVEIPIIGDQVYNVHERGGACARKVVRLVALLRIDPAVSVPAPPREPGTNGRRRKPGQHILAHLHPEQ
jgi:hypothetical protein